MKNKYYSKNIAIIIPTNGTNYTINKVLKSISAQSVKPGQVIIISTKENQFKSSKNFYFVFSKKKSQVYQRSLAKNCIKKNIRLILQLDDYVMLEKNSLKELIKEWNSSNKDVVGIGLLPSNYNPPKPNLLQIMLDKNVLNSGRVLKSGYVTAWGKNFFSKKTEWLAGGSTSWKYNKDIFNRKYPISKWSVAEDVIFSYKKNSKFKLKLTKKSKVKYLKKQNLITLNESFKRGFFLSKVMKNFVVHNKNLSLSNFYISTFFLSLSGLVINLFKLDIKKSFYHLGRFVSFWLNTYDYKIK